MNLNVIYSLKGDTTTKRFMAAHSSASKHTDNTVWQRHRLAPSLLAGRDFAPEEMFEKIYAASDHSELSQNLSKDWFGTRLKLNDEDGSGYWDYLRFANDFSITVSNFTSHQQRTLLLPGTGLLDIHVKLEGHSLVTSEYSEAIEMIGPTVSAGNQPEGLDTLITIFPEREASVTFYFKPDYFYDNLASQIEDIPDALARYIFNRGTGINNYLLPANADILDAAASIIGSGDRFKNRLWLNHVHGCCEELVCYVIEAFEKLPSCSPNAYSQAQIEQLRQARSIISQQLESSPTIEQLAKQVGTSQTKLKSGFKTLFGETILECRNRLRMQKAVQLIHEGVPIALVSEKVGFQQPTSFARAFKAYYGFKARDCRKVIRELNFPPHH